MHISKVNIQNFRNFENVTISTSNNLLLVGANATGKSNFIYALRLVLDPGLSRRDRILTADDFFHGDGLLPWRGRVIKVSVEITGFADNQNLRSFLDDYNSGQPGFAIISYIYKPRGNVIPEQSQESDYEFRIYGGNDESNEVTQLFRHMNLRVIDALRNAESELVARRIPLKALLDLYGINGDALQDVIIHLQEANDRIKELSVVQELETDLANRLQNIKEHVHELDPILRLTASSAEDIVRALRILLGRDRLLPINTTSLGLANLLFLALSMLEIEKRESITGPIGESVYEFIVLAIEEPEAHLHTHVQRLLFRDFLKRSPIILSTHSPHIASVAPIDSILMFRKPSLTEGTKISSTSQLKQLLDPTEITDLERYLDVTRAEIVFARAVIFVEGDAEEFTLAPLARLIGYDLDKYGITICNIRGTNFSPYVTLVGPDGLNIPFAILTDGDKYANLRKVAIPQARQAEVITDDEAQVLKTCTPFDLRTELESRSFAYYDGLKRCIQLLDIIQADDSLKTEIVEDYDNLRWADVNQKLQGVGVFVNEWSFEPALIEAGYANEILEVLEECGAGPQIVSTLHRQLSVGYLEEGQVEYWVKQINNVGKGRISQRLSSKLKEISLPGGREVPSYIKASIEYVVQMLQPTTTVTEESESSLTDLGTLVHSDNQE